MTVEPPAGAAAESNPYAEWAVLTGGVHVPHRELGQWYALRCHARGTVGRLRRAAPSALGWWIPPAYPDHARACTVRVTDVEAAAPTLAAWRGLARLLEADAGMARPDQPRTRLPPLVTTGDGAASPPDAARTVVAVIDSACGFAQRRFCRPGETPTTRLAAYWDQGGDQGGTAPAPARPGGWHTPPRFGYGRALRRADIDTLLATHLPTGVVDDGTRREAEAALYRAIDHGVPQGCDWTHGTHMLDLCSRTDPAASAWSKAGDPLAQAALVHVQLPGWAMNDTSARWAAACVLDGLRFVLDCAGPQAEVVVNLSLGAFGGPHDGSSLLEQAIDDLVAEQAPRLHVVVAAGNAALPLDDGTDRPRPCHARAWLAPAGQPGAQCTLDLEVDLPDGGETFVELWLPQDAAAPGAAGGLGLTVHPPAPTGTAPRPLATQPGGTARLVDGQQVVAAVFNRTAARTPTALGDGGMALVALGTTLNLLGYRAPTGRWQLRLANQLPVALVADLWLQRRDVPGDMPGHRAQYGFVGLPAQRPAGPGSAWTSGQGTLGSLAHGRQTVVVAAVEPVHDGTAWARGNYSSAGQPPRRRGHTALERSTARRAPDLALPGTATAAGFWTGSAKSLQGTSVAAAQLTCLLAREAARNPGLGRQQLLQRLTGQPDGTARRPGTPDLGQALLVGGVATSAHRSD